VCFHSVDCFCGLTFFGSSEAKGLLATLQRGKQGQSDTGGPNYRNVLEILLRMRQICNHIGLCGERVEALMRFAQDNPGQKVVMNRENVSLLQDLLQLVRSSSLLLCWHTNRL